jgi:hypothetical protein
VAKVTVLTPSLPERAEMLAEACASVAAQTFPAAAHLIGVDYDRKGPATIINQLVTAASTEWLAILADDDLFDPDHLEILMGEKRHADMILSWCRIVGRETPQYRGEFTPYDLLQRRDTGMRGTFLFRKSLWERVGGWPPSPLEDWKFMAACVQAKARLVPVYRETWTYRLHPGSFSVLTAPAESLTV